MRTCDWPGPFSDAMPRPAWPTDLANGFCENARVSSPAEMDLNSNLASHQLYTLGKLFIVCKPRSPLTDHAHSEELV